MRMILAFLALIAATVAVPSLHACPIMAHAGPHTAHAHVMQPHAPPPDRAAAADGCATLSCWGMAAPDAATAPWPPAFATGRLWAATALPAFSDRPGGLDPPPPRAAI